MRIHDTRGPQGEMNVGGATQPRRGAGAASSTPSEASGQASVKVKLSSRAIELAGQSGLDEAKVERLKEKIASGDFKVDARAIARKLVGEDA